MQIADTKTFSHSQYCSVCNVALTFCGDSFSQINCFGRCNHVSLVLGANGFWLIVLILSHVITGLWSE